MQARETIIGGSPSTFGMEIQRAGLINIYPISAERAYELPSSSAAEMRLDLETTNCIPQLLDCTVTPQKISNSVAFSAAVSPACLICGAESPTDCNQLFHNLSSLLQSLSADSSSAIARANCSDALIGSGQ
ncbi:hypothetical protein GGH92_010247, partial [Coemansia sp. RSA 2673]